MVFTGVIKSIVGEITDHTNSADAFAMLHVPWAMGTSFGYEIHHSPEMKLSQWLLLLNLQRTGWRLAFPTS